MSGGSDGRPRTGWRIIPGQAETRGETWIILLWKNCTGAPWGARIRAHARPPPCHFRQPSRAARPRLAAATPHQPGAAHTSTASPLLHALPRIDLPPVSAWSHRTRPPGAWVRGPGAASPSSLASGQHSSRPPRACASSGEIPFKRSCLGPRRICSTSPAAQGRPRRAVGPRGEALHPCRGQAAFPSRRGRLPATSRGETLRNMVKITQTV